MPIRWNLRAVLKAQGITAYRLAKLAGISVPSAYELVKHDPITLKIETLDALCRVLDCQPGDLLDYRKR